MSPSIKRIEIYLHACVKKLGNEVLWWQPLGRAWVGYGSAVQGLYHCDFMRNLPVWACWQVQKGTRHVKRVPVGRIGQY